MIGAAILLREIKKIYKVGPIFVETLKSVDFVAEEGQKALVCGQDRAGRSALMRILGLIEQPTAGEVFIDDENLTDISHVQMCAIRSSTFGYISDLFPLIPSQTAIENAQLPLVIRGELGRKEIKARIRECLEYAGASDFSHEPARKLNDEEQRRVLLARAIAGEPMALWIDDPWFSRGGEPARRILDNIWRIAGGVGLTLVMSADKAPDGAVFDYSIKIKDGRADFS